MQARAGGPTGRQAALQARVQDHVVSERIAACPAGVHARHAAQRGEAGRRPAEYLGVLPPAHHLAAGATAQGAWTGMWPQALAAGVGC